MNPWLFAFLAPVWTALLNIIEKILMSKRINHPLSFAFYAGIAQIVYGSALALLLDWNNISKEQMVFPFLAGFLIGTQLYLYFLMMKKEDASYVVSFIYVSPILTAILSFLFLGEVLSIVAYIGIMLLVSGAIVLTVRLHSIKLTLPLWVFGLLVVLVALSSFTMKIASINIGSLHGLAINCLGIGLAIMPALISKEVRLNLKPEFRNIKFAFLTEGMIAIAFLFTYIALKDIEVAIVASIGAIQPLAVAIFEFIGHKFVAGIQRDKDVRFKILSILLIIIGVVLITIA